MLIKLELGQCGSQVIHTAAPKSIQPPACHPMSQPVFLSALELPSSRAIFMPLIPSFQSAILRALFLVAGNESLEPSLYVKNLTCMCFWFSSRLTFAIQAWRRLW